jgi:NTE family protein
MNAVDLGTGETVWLGAGGDDTVSVATAVLASCSLPLFYPPVELNGRYLVDGGVNDNLPIAFAAERGAARIIAIDVGAGGKQDAEKIVGQGMVAIHHRVSEIMAYPRKLERLASWDGPPLVYVRPRIEQFSTFEFGQTTYFLEEGYRATREALSRGPATRSELASLLEPQSGG